MPSYVTRLWADTWRAHLQCLSDPGCPGHNSSLLLKQTICSTGICMLCSLEIQTWVLSSVLPSGGEALPLHSYVDPETSVPWPQGEFWSLTSAYISLVESGGMCSFKTEPCPILSSSCLFSQLPNLASLESATFLPQ